MLWLVISLQILWRNPSCKKLYIHASISLTASSVISCHPELTLQIMLIGHLTMEQLVTIMTFGCYVSSEIIVAFNKL